MKPFYLSLSDKEFKTKINLLYKLLQNCQLCPRKCGVNRLKGEKGFCQTANKPIVSSAHPHFGEESVLVGKGPISSLL